MAELYTCYSPKGEKFELPRANYLDCIQHYGWTKGPPSGVAPVSEAPAPVSEAPVEQAPAATESEQVPAADPEKDADEELDFDAMDKDTLKAFIRANFPDAEFDGRASRETLADLAFELVTKADEAKDAAAN